MGLIFNRKIKNDSCCPGIHVVGGTTIKCCDLSLLEGPGPIPDPTKDPIQRVVTLVHGTFATHAPWMQDDPKEKPEEGILCQALHEKGTAIRRFCWSGGNSHSARLQAGNDLAIYLNKLKTEFPDARHFVIAHSHGGNVALYAMEANSSDGKKLSEWITGVVTLATPFISSPSGNENFQSR